MRILNDKDNNLIWQGFNFDGDTMEQGGSDRERLMRLNKSINHWRNDDIRAFIEKNYSIGDFFNAVVLLEDKRHMLQFFAFEGEACVATMLISTKQYLYEKIALEHYVLDNIKRSEAEIFLSQEYARKLLFNNTDNNNIELSYFVVDPEKQGQGIGKRAARSVLSHLDFFSDIESGPNAVTGYIHKDNIASRKVFVKNNFKPLKPCKEFDTCGHVLYFFSPKDKTHDVAAESELID